ncbi:MAG: DoxX family protein [Bacteroidetes bacterium]|nr:DoxX family protein [Bacteroidota bacterium]
MTKALAPKAGDKKFKIIAYILGVAHLIFGLTKLIGQPGLTKEFTVLWQFPLWFMYFVGAAQVLGGLALFTRQLRMPASLAMALIMIGAIATTIVSGQWGNAAVCCIVLVLCLITFVARLKDLAIELATAQGYNKQ